MHLKKLPDRPMKTLKIIYLDVTSRFSKFANNFVKELALCDWSIYPILGFHSREEAEIKTETF